MTTYPAGVTTLLNTVRTAVADIKGLHVEPFARGVLITTRPADTEGVSRINRAHAALRVSDVPLSRIKRQAPNVIRVLAPRKRRNRAGRVTRDA